MRVLFTAPPAIGHFHPLVPLAAAARDAGHTVAFATPPEFAPMVERVGFEHRPAGLEGSAPEMVRLLEARGRLSGSERAAFMQREGFAGVIARGMAADLLGICDVWQPDVLVRDAWALGGCVAAETRNIPHAIVQSTAPRAWVYANIAEPLAALRAAHGLPPDPELWMLERYLALSPFPPSLDGLRDWPRPTLHRYRVLPFDRSGDESTPAWPLPFPDAPLVYATLGTVLNARTDILGHFVEALRDERVNLVVTVGRNGDPGQFGPQPPNVRIERYIPQSSLFPRCDLVICHGGSGTVLAAVAHGIPMVLTPFTSDQPANAERCAALGLARVVMPADVSATTIREAALDVLHDPTYRQGAARLRAEMDALPDLEYVVGLLERLAHERAPILA